MPPIGVGTPHKVNKAAVRRLQYAALPYRHENGAIEVMLITSRDTGRWIIPKGWRVQRLGEAASAAREALEESGVVGRIGRRSIGRYRYSKRLADGASVNCRVKVFPLKVKKQLSTWPERKQRRTRWFSLSKALKAVDDPGLRAIIRKLTALAR